MDTFKIPGPAGTYEVPIHRAPLGTRILQGMALPAGLMLLRVLGASGAGLSLGQIFGSACLVAIGGGTGGAVYYATDAWRVRGGLTKTIANALSLLVYGIVTMVLMFWALGTE